MKTKVQLAITGAALAALLAFTWVHTGSLLAHYVQPSFVGYVAAFGIEAAVVSLSLRIGDLKRTQQSVKFFLFVLVSVVIVSAIANIAEGFRTAQGVKLTSETVKQLDVVQAVIGLSATGLISLIVLALSEIVGTDVNATVKIVQRERKAEQKKVSKTTGIIPTAEQAQAARDAKATKDAATKDSRLDALLGYLDAHPDTTITAAGKAIGVSRQTASAYIGELGDAERLNRNGNGWEVLQ